MCAVHLRAVGRAVLNDPLQFFMDELHTTHAGLLQSLDLFLHQQLETHLRNKQSRPRTLRPQNKPIHLRYTSAYRTNLEVLDRSAVPLRSGWP